MTTPAEIEQVKRGMASLTREHSFICPVCDHTLDIQGIDRGHRTTFDCWCHGCNAHITIRIKP